MNTFLRAASTSWWLAGTLMLAIAGVAHAQAPAAPASPSPAPVRAVVRAVVAGPVIAPPPAPARPTVDPVRLEAFLDGWIGQAMVREHIPGVAVSVVQDGQLVLKKGYGYADVASGRRVDPDRTLFRIGSISKTFTWLLVMRDVEAGRMRLDRPINLYLPERARLPDPGGRVLVRRLMDHSAGFEDRSLGQLFENDPSRVRPLELYVRQERPRIVRTPGAISSYSNYGAGLAGLATATVAGKPFETRVESEITGPLGMARTTFREARPERRGLPAAMSQRLWGDVAKGYGWREGGYKADDYEYIGQIAPAGSASSTAADMSLYMRMLLNGGSLAGAQVLSPDMLRLVQTPLRRAAPGVNGWAHGFETIALPGGRKGFGHLGHTLAFTSNMTLAPELGLGVFVTTNSEHGAVLSDDLPAEIIRLFYATPPAAPRAGSAQLVDAAGIYKGDYISTRRAQGGLEGFVSLFPASLAVTVSRDGRLLTSDGKAWAPEGDVRQGRFVAVQGDERLVFALRDGKAVAIQPASNTEAFLRAGLLEKPRVLVWLAAATLFASITTLIGLALRNRRDLRQNDVQARASLIQNTQAGLWLVSAAFFGGWAMQASDVQKLMYGWPGPLLLTASAAALVAAALTVLTALALPSVWQGGRRVDSWGGGRKLFYTITVLVYAAFSVALSLNGALAPWRH